MAFYNSANNGGGSRITGGPCLMNIGDNPDLGEGKGGGGGGGVISVLSFLAFGTPVSALGPRPDA